MAWKSPVLTNSDLWMSPRRLGSTRGPCVMTVNRIMPMLISASVDALASFAMSRYMLNGQLTPMTVMTITALLLVRSQRNRMSERLGNSPAMTSGKVSPMITQNATMPPNANAHCARLIAINPALPKQCCMVAWNESAPDSFELITINRIVQSTVMVSPISSITPIVSPAWRKAYGCPMIPAPIIEFAMFVNADSMLLVGLAFGRCSSG